jgi:uncharacterized delta-60 repeat protein
MVTSLRAILVVPIVVLMTGVALLSCGTNSGIPALAQPGISTVVITAINGDTNARAKAVAIQSDGKIVAVGYSYDGTKNVFALARYINDGVTDGTLDGSFGTGGIVTTPIGTVDAQAQALAVQSDGKLVVAGFAFFGGQYRFALARYDDTDGSLDASFNPCPVMPTEPCDGIVTTAIDTVDDRAFAVAIQSDDKIVVAGYSNEDTGTGIQSRLVVVRYKADGTLDDTFDSDGIAIFDASTYVSSSDPTAMIFSAGAFALAIQSDQKLVAAGFAYMSLTDGNQMRRQDEFLLVRYNPDGSPDSTLNGGDLLNASGAVTTAIGKVNDDVNALAVDENGKLVAAGSSYDTQGTFGVVRYNSDGTLDTTFNGTGKVTTAIDTNASVSAVAIQTDGKLVVAGRGYNNTYGKFAIARYNTDGHLDGTFGSSGKVSTAITYGAEAFGLAIQDGKPIAAGYSQAQQEPEKFTLVRYLTDGTVDTTFPPQP